jgi:predicted DNA-binding transcriptional regulator AlpA
MSGYLRAPDVAELCGVQIRTVREWTRRYKVPHRRLPRTNTVLFVEAEIREWIDDPTIELDIKRGAEGARVVKPLVAR